jgi:hypothetical protein
MAGGSNIPGAGGDSVNPVSSSFWTVSSGVGVTSIGIANASTTGEGASAVVTVTSGLMLFEVEGS